MWGKPPPAGSGSPAHSELLPAPAGRRVINHSARPGWIGRRHHLSGGEAHVQRSALVWGTRMRGTEWCWWSADNGVKLLLLRKAPSFLAGVVLA